MDTLKKLMKRITRFFLPQTRTKKYTELWDEIKNQTETINGGKPPIKYKKDFMKIRFESSDNFPLVQILSVPRYDNSC